MYGIDIKNFVRLAIPPFLRGKALNKMAHVLLRLDEQAWGATMEGLRRDARFAPQAGVIAARVRRMLTETGTPSVNVTVQDSAANNPNQDFVVVVEEPMSAAFMNRLQAWLDRNTTAGKRGRIVNQIVSTLPAVSTVQVQAAFYGNPSTLFANLQWTNPNAVAAGVTHTEIWVSTLGSNERYTLLATRPIGEVFAMDHQIQYNVTYWFRLRNINQVTGSVSDYLTSSPFVRTDGTAVTSAPVLSASRDGAQVNLTWTHPGGAVGFLIFRAFAGQEFTTLAIASVAEPGRSAFDASAVAARYKVAAYGAGWQGADSNIVSVGAQSTVPPPTGNTTTDPQPTSTKLAPTPYLVVNENRTPAFDWSGIPNQTMPADLILALDCGGSAQDNLTALTKGATHIDSQVLDSEGQDPVTGKNYVGADVPYKRRFRLAYENMMSSPGASRYVGRDRNPNIGGRLPRDVNDENDIRSTVMTFCDNGGRYNDNKNNELTALDYETGPAAGVDAFAWESIKKSLMLDPLQAKRGTEARWPGDMKFQMTNQNNVDPWKNVQDYSDGIGYFKPRMTALRNGQYLDATFQTHRTQHIEFWQKQGAWAGMIVNNIMHAKKLNFPRQLSFIATYHENYQDMADNATDMQYYKLRDDVAEGMAIIPYMMGVKGIWPWNRVRVGEWRNSEKAVFKGAWRIIQHSDMFTGGQSYIVPEWSADGGATWQRSLQPNDTSYFLVNMALEQTTDQVPNLAGSANDIALTVLGGYVETPQWNLTPPITKRRIHCYGVVNAGKILIMALDAWQWDQNQTRDLKVRYVNSGAGINFQDDIRLYGRKIYLGKSSIS